MAEARAKRLTDRGERAAGDENQRNAVGIGLLGPQAMGGKRVVVEGHGGSGRAVGGIGAESRHGGDESQRARKKDAPKSRSGSRTGNEWPGEGREEHKNETRKKRDSISAGGVLSRLRNRMRM